MSYAPQTIAAVGALFVGHGFINDGIVGDTAHTWGYHIGRDRIFMIPPGLGWSDVSVQTARDKAGLTDAAAALDISHANKAELRRWSSWLAARKLANDPTTRDLHEIIYSPDGLSVYCVGDYPTPVKRGPGCADSSHLWHTHLSFYRDSEARSKLAMFTPYWTPVTTTTNLFPGGAMYRLPLVNGHPTLGYGHAPAFRAHFDSVTLGGAIWWRAGAGAPSIYAGYYVPRGVLQP
jgi:hypothetical protein